MTRYPLSLTHTATAEPATFFQINAAGARVDGLIDNPESASLDWDGIWDARTAKTADGWSAEIVIPSRTLSFAVALSNGD